LARNSQKFFRAHPRQAQLAWIFLKDSRSFEDIDRVIRGGIKKHLSALAIDIQKFPQTFMIEQRKLPMDI
jgi:hypothetical protein